MRRLGLLVIAACTKEPEPQPAVAPPRVVVADAAVADAGPAAVTHISLLDRDVVCFDGASCLRLTSAGYGHDYHARPATDADRTITFTDGCTWKSDELACASGSIAARAVFGREEHYLVEGDQVEWFAFDDNTAKRHPLAVAHVAKLSVGFRAACALTADAAVWCWSDPAKPKRMTVPAHVADLAVIDPFALCVRTSDGAVSCTPPYVEADNFACSSSSKTCGLGTVEQADIDHGFDPLVPLSRPLARVVGGASVLAADDSLLYIIDMGVLKFQPDEPFGACAKGDAGVTCWKPCGKQWNVFAVDGVPADATLAPDQDAGNALAADGHVWSWQGTCDASHVGATALALPPIAELLPALFVRSGPQLWSTTRCASTRAHGVACWSHRDRQLPIGSPFDPRLL